MSVGIQVYSRRVKWAYVRKLLMSQVLSVLSDLTPTDITHEPKSQVSNLVKPLLYG
jgi:hypothetical protein